MPLRKSTLIPLAIVGLGVPTYVLVAGTTGFCPACQSVTTTLFNSGAVVPAQHESTAPARPDVAEDGFRLVNRPGSVDLGATYDLQDLSIPRDEIHTLLPKDAIPSLTDPVLTPVRDADWPSGDARVIAVSIGKEAVAVPLSVLNAHEIVNMTLGGVPIAATYCPLCDSASVFDRTVSGDDGKPLILEFGVSGALYNSNVLMYDRDELGLWSQLAMKAVSGPRAGTHLRHMPVRVITYAAFASAYPAGLVVGPETGFPINYDRDPYERYFASDDTLVPVRGIGTAIERKKTLGLGILAGSDAWFIPVDAIGDDGVTIDTPLGPVRAEVGEAGVNVLEAPEGAHTAQTFYYSWSAFHPETIVIGIDDE